MRRIIFVLVGLLLVSVAKAESYLCVPDMATGFIFDRSDKKWRDSPIDVAGKAFLIKRPTQAQRDYLKYRNPPNIEWVVLGIGKKFTGNACSQDFRDTGWLFCNDDMYLLQFNKKNLRYLRVYKWGYWDVDVMSAERSDLEAENTPFMVIGKCTRID